MSTAAVVDDEWRDLVLDDVAEVVGGGTPATSNGSFWGGAIPWITPSEVTRHEGEVVRETERTITEEGLAASSATLLPEGTVLVTSRATVGAVAMAGHSMATNQGFASLVTKDAVLPHFLMNWVQANRVEFQKRASGSTFPEITRSKVKSIPIRLPKVSVQRRIVDLVGILDSSIERERLASAAASSLLYSALLEHVTNTIGQAQRVVDCCIRVVGGVWGDEPGIGDVDVAALGPRIYLPGTPGLVVVGSPIRSFSARQVETRLVRPGDIVLERSGGSPSQPVGRVVIASGDEPACVPTDFQRLVRPDPAVVMPRYLFWRLWCDWRAGVTLGYSRRTTGITNLSVTQYLNRLISVPPIPEQQRLVGMIDSMADSVSATDLCVLQLQQLRTSVLTGLMSGDIEIPETYDTFLEAS